MEDIDKILKLSNDRIEHFIKNHNHWYQGHETYVNAVFDEVVEAKKEIKKDNSVYLEDELWDIFWTYVCMLTSLEKEWYISRDKVFERTFKKYAERIDYVEVQNKDRPWSWEEIKKIQKERREQEHNNFYNKK